MQLVDNKTFFVALEKLENEGYITGVRFIRVMKELLQHLLMM